MEIKGPVERTKCTNINIIRISDGKKRKREKRIYEEIVTENVLNLIKVRYLF